MSIEYSEDLNLKLLYFLRNKCESKTTETPISHSSVPLAAAISFKLSWNSLLLLLFKLVFCSSAFDLVTNNSNSFYTLVVLTAALECQTLYLTNITLWTNVESKLHCRKWGCDVLICPSLKSNGTF